MNKLALMWKLADVRKKIFSVLVLLIFTRILANIPIPSIDTAGIKAALQQNDFLGLLNIFSGGGLKNLSLAMIGVGPYITASIIVQLLTVIIPSWQEKQKEEGELGRLALNKYTRYLTVPLAALQGFGTIRLLQSQSQGLFSALTPFQWFVTLLSITAGSMLVMWIGEIITEVGCWV
jgi:preprotein translocase subunit SecY